MSLIVEDNGGDFERCSTGNHLARCYRIVDLGTQKNEYLGQVKYMHKVAFSWEVHGTDDNGNPLLMKDGRPFGIFKNYTLSWAEKATLRNDLQSWRGKPFNQEELRKFDLKNVLGAWCMLNIIDKPSSDGKKVYSNVSTISPVPAIYKQNGLPKPINPNELFTLQDPDMAMFETFHVNLKAKIMASPEWTKIQEKKGEEYAREQSASANSMSPDMDDIPF